MKLIKLNTDHYVVVADSEIKEGDWVLTEENTIHQVDYVDAYTKINACKKITHSNIGHLYQDSILLLSLQEVKELLGEVDVEKKAMIEYEESRGNGSEYAGGAYSGYINGYNQAIEDNKEKKYTEEDLRRYHNIMCLHGNKKGKEFIQSLQPKTEWEVEIVDGKLKLK